jgi:hypothetical protein
VLIDEAKVGFPVLYAFFDARTTLDDGWIRHVPGIYQSGKKMTSERRTWPG